MITENFVWKSIVSCLMCKRGHGRVTPTTEPKEKQEKDKDSADSKINKLVILQDGGEAPIKNALESLPSNGISDDGSRLNGDSIIAVERNATESEEREISIDKVATATKTQTLTIGAGDSMPPIALESREELNIERLEQKEKGDDSSKLPPINELFKL
ncbi:hypothetical protein PMAYCL1PPCAC_07792 [Pristionchus mayeri]|uniref:Uncharacterized protein n=1 Tax=Pristionchus mayeri TaxID=1317129 RepID=A0AAN4ZAK5_9BILA|nr:hypothetical protein PMAYCL1PPCAC_07792 [Pristionchus mayeri]